jgi:dipeptidyl aminopeptidase/acylaminoacyl peptidase
MTTTKPRTQLTRLVLFLTFALAALGAPAWAQSAKRALTLDDLAKVRAVHDPQCSPEGQWVAYTVTTVDVEGDKTDSDIWMTSWDGTRHVRMTSSKDSETTPRWSPDGRYLGFLAARGDEDVKKRGAQVWLLDRAGGEAQKLTDIKGGVSDFAWSPDAKRLILVSKDPDPDAEPESKQGWKRKTKPPLVLDRYWFKDDGDGYLGGLRTHLWLFDVAARKAEALTSGPYDDELPAWAPDGSLIAFVSKRGPDPDRSNDSNIFVVAARPGAEPRQLTTFPGRDGGRPSWSPDGKWIAYLQGPEPRFSAYGTNTPAVVPAAGGPARELCEPLDRAVHDPIVWSPDGGSLVFSVEDDRTVWVGRVAAAGGVVAKLTSGRRVAAPIAPGPGGQLAVLAATATELPEVYALENGALRRLTHHNDAWLDEVRLGSTEDISFTTQDGAVVNGLMVKPASFIAGQRYPTILLIHGGPNGQDEHEFSFDRELLAAHGYVVLAVNYRGSAGRGAAYLKAIYADWCNKEVTDLRAAADWAVAAGIADPGRLGIGGWSYGGILTDATIAADARFKAAVSGAGSALQLTMYGTDEYVVQYEHELGPPWQHLDLWLKVSAPFLHADRIKTPTLFLGGDRDFNVPIAGGEQMYQALKSLGVDAELVVYPDQHHGLSLPSYRRDRFERYLAWFDKYLMPKGAPAAAAAKP